MQDTIILPMADMHSGSPYSLFPNKQMQLVSTNHSQTPLQKIIRGQFDEVCDFVKSIRTGKRVIVINMGDAIEGLHHSTKEVITQYLVYQQKIHVELMTELSDRIGGWDKLIYINGTPAHAGEAEFEIAKDLGAEYYRQSLDEGDEGESTWPELRAMIEGTNKIMWAAHHGPAAGRELSRGVSLRNKLKEIYYRCMATGKVHPDFVVWADKHEHRHGMWEDERNGHIIHGFICPSWKAKDSYVYKVAALEDPNIGALVLEVGEDIKYHFKTLEIEQDKMVTI